MLRALQATVLAGSLLSTPAICAQEFLSRDADGLPDATQLEFVMLEFPGQLIVTQVRQVPVTVTEMREVARERIETRTKLIDGQEKTYTVRVPYVEQVEVQREIRQTVREQKTIDFGTVKFSSTTGQIVKDTEKLKKHLRTPRPAVILYGDAQLHPLYAKVLKSSLIVMNVPESQREQNPIFAPDTDTTQGEFYESDEAPSFEPAEAEEAPPAPFEDRTYGGIK